MKGRQGRGVQTGQKKVLLAVRFLPATRPS